MVKHIIIWNFKAEMSVEEVIEAGKNIKEKLEALQGKIDGLTEIKVITDMLSSSNGDIMLDSTFTSEEALAGYQVHPDHVEAAGYVRSVVAERKCVDFEI